MSSAFSSRPEVLDLPDTDGSLIGGTPEMLRARLAAAAEQHGLRASGLVGLRYRLTDGEGHWDFLKIADDLIVNIANVTYRRDTWIDVPGDDVFKVRVLLSGTLTTRTGKVILDGSGAYLAAYPGRSADGYFIKGGVPTRLLILQCNRSLLVDRMGLDVTAIPPPLSTLFSDGPKAPSGANVRLGSEVLRAANDVLRSPAHYPASLRRAYIDARCLEIVCAVLRQLAEPPIVIPPGMKLTMRDVSRVYEARDILLDNFATPPSLKALARGVGLNQTKLKAAFKVVFGVTAFDFVRRCRMDAAADLLRSTDRTIAEIAYEVGFEYPANFTHSFRRHFGYLPSEVKRPG